MDRLNLTKGCAVTFSFPFRINIHKGREFRIFEVTGERGQWFKLYPPLHVKAETKPPDTANDALEEVWPNFRWHRTVDRRKVGPPNRDIEFNYGSDQSLYCNSIRIDVGGLRERDDPQIFKLANLFLRLIREYTRQYSVTGVDLNTHFYPHYTFGVSRDGSALTVPGIHVSGAVPEEWVQPLTESGWRTAFENAVKGESPTIYWQTFLDALLQKDSGNYPGALLSLALSLEIARETIYPAFAPVKVRPSGTFLDRPFNNTTDLLKHLSTDLEGVHSRQANLAKENPNLYQELKRLYVCRHLVAHGKQPLIDVNNAKVPPNSESVREMINATYEALVWMEGLVASP